MKAKTPSPAQLAARKKFAEMAKNGTLAKKRTAAAKKKGLKAPPTPRQIERQKENLQKLRVAHAKATSPERKRNLAAHIKIAEAGLKAPATKGLQTLCAKTFSTTGLRKKDGTQKKGFVRKKGGKIVKVATKKK